MNATATPSNDFPSAKAQTIIMGSTDIYTNMSDTIIWAADISIIWIFIPENPKKALKHIDKRALKILNTIVKNKSSQNLAISNFLYEIGTVKIDFNVSSVVSLEIMYTATNVIIIGKNNVQLLIITCCIKYWKSHTLFVLAVE